MARKERVSRGKTMRPNYFVFCEGETEVAYTEMLRSHYRLPIHIIAKKTLQNVTTSLVERCKAMYVQTAGDRTYLMYDLDVAEMLERLHKVKGAVLLCSNPCFELWLLLHYQAVTARLSSADCMKKLTTVAKQYKKGSLADEMVKQLNDNARKASERAKDLQAYGNPSTTVYRLVEELQRMKKDEKEKFSACSQ